MLTTQTRRRFLTNISLAGAAAILPRPAVAAERALETTTVRLANDGGICFSPGIAEELLRAEGMKDIRYADVTGGPRTFASAGVDFKSIAPWDVAVRIDSAEPVVVLGGVHIGCFELFARESIRSVADLRGKSVGSSWTRLVALMAAHVGLDPVNDIRIITDPRQKPMELFVEGKVDAFLGFPPEPQKLHARRVGHVILNTTVAHSSFLDLIGASTQPLGRLRRGLDRRVKPSNDGFPWRGHRCR
jgi:NitT/TauT family transport system substrate-binding protein